MAGIWLVGHASAIWPFLLVGTMLALSWSALREIHPRQVRAAFHALDLRWMAGAAVLTAINVAVMGLYDVVAFRHTRTSALQRWRFGAVAFAWSNFLTLGPVAGPTIRLWLYRDGVDRRSDLHGGIASVAFAFTSGLAGWVAATALVSLAGGTALHLVLLSLPLVFCMVWLGRIAVGRLPIFSSIDVGVGAAWPLALVGWLDWLLASGVFVACLRASGVPGAADALVRTFFNGQAIGLASLVPGGLGSSDAYWIASLATSHSALVAALLAYRAVYYVIPWAMASLLLLADATRHAARRLEVARRIMGGLVGGAGALMILSAASPALRTRLAMLEQTVPLPLVEVGHLAAALAGVVLLVLARGLSQGYRAAFRATVMILTLGSVAALLKGLDWEEAVILGLIALAARSQAALFDRPSRGDWLEAPDLVLAFGAVAMLLAFGTFSHRINPATLDHWAAVGYHLESARFMRTAASVVLAVAAAAGYLLMRVPIRFSRTDPGTIDRALSRHAEIGSGTSAMIVATGDKCVFESPHGLCLYRTIGPYLLVFADPSGQPADRGALLDDVFAFARTIDRRPAFYQISAEWIPLLHDRGYHFFKLGEEALIPLSRVTLEGHAGKMYRQVLRRAERDRLTFRVLQPADIRPRLREFATISRAWLEEKQLAERQFSLGFFDETYLLRFPCAVVEDAATGHLVAFANLLEGPRREELSVDLMRHGTDPRQVMDFLILSVLLDGQRAGYRTFNLGMAPLATVGAHRGAHVRERLAHLFFQRGEHWYNFQGLRFFKEKFDPDWVPRYLAYQNPWEWPAAIAHASALIAGGWTRILLPPRDLEAEAGPAVELPPPAPAAGL